MESPALDLHFLRGGDLQVWHRGIVLGAVSKPLPKAPSSREARPQKRPVSGSGIHK